MKMEFRKILILLFIIIESTNSTIEDIQAEEKTVNYSAMDSPFRTQKCNMLWTKAQ